MEYIPMTPTVAVLVTCFNRREKTLSALESVFGQREVVPRRLTVILVDDASTDGTPEAVASRFPQVRVLTGSGSLFWNGGMRVAFAEAMRSDFDYYLWLNDDTHLFPEALDVLLASAQKLEHDGRTAIMTSSTCDPVERNWTYGGFRLRISWRGVRLLPIKPLSDELQPCDTMNGNCTLIPRTIAEQVGNLDAVFQHGIGDFDYGFRTREAGFGIYAAPGYIGTCTGNSNGGTWRDGDASFSKRWHHLTSPKGLPIKEWLIYTRRHYGAFWPLYTVSPYVKTLVGFGLCTGDLKDDGSRASKASAE